MSGNEQSGKRYETTFRQMVKGLYMEFRTVEAVHRELKRRGHKPPEIKTLRKWEKEEDWRASLDLRDKLVGEEGAPEMDDLDSLIRNQKAMLRIALNEIATKQKDGTIKISGGDPQKLHAYNRLAETLGRLLGIKRQIEKDKTDETPSEIIFAALMKDKDLGRYLGKAEVRSRLKDLIAQEIMLRTRKAVGLG